MRTIIALLLVTLTIPSLAAEPILVVTKSGFYLLTEDANGVPVTTKIKKVVTTDGVPPVDTPNPPDVPAPPTESELTKQVREWAKQTQDPRGANAMALVIRETVKLSQEGKISDADIYNAIGRANDAVLQSIGSLNKWVTFRGNTQLGGLLTTLAQTGQIPNQKAKERILLEVAAGLETAYPESALDGELFQKIIEIIMLILRTFFAENGTGI